MKNMTAIGPTTRATIKAHLEVFIEKLVDAYRGRVMPNSGNPTTYLTQQSPKGRLKPFHAAMIPLDVILT